MMLFLYSHPLHHYKRQEYT